MSCFLGELLQVFHHFFFRYFHFATDFFYCFQVLSLLIAFGYFHQLQLFYHCFFRWFHFTTDFYYCFSGVFISPTFFTMIVFLSGTSFLCCGTVSATNFKVLFLLSGVFYLTYLPDTWNNLLLSRLPWEPAVLP